VEKMARGTFFASSGKTTSPVSMKIKKIYPREAKL